jgi:glutathione synthase/RimK-type ligase-like ATP-grasp enzyme
VRGGAVVAVVVEAAALMRVGVIGRFSPQRDATLGALVDATAARGHDVVVLDIARLITGPVAFSPTNGHLILGDVEVHLDALDALWLGPLPAASARVAPDDVTLRTADVDVLRKRQAARHALGWSIALCAEARGVPVLSSPSRARPFDFKPFQLAALHAAGVAVPATDVADRADDDHNDRIIKPVIGGPVIAADGFTDVDGVPVLRQPRLRGRQLRLAVVDGVVVAAAAITADDVIDSRQSARPWRPVTIDAALQDLGARCARVCHFDVCAIDVVDTTAGLVVLDVNRTPQLMDLAHICAVDIAGRCVDLLERRCIRAP